MPYVYLIKPNASQETNLYKIMMTNIEMTDGCDTELICCNTDYPRTIEKKLIETFDSMFDKKNGTNEYYVDISEKQVKRLFMSIIIQTEQLVASDDSSNWYS